MCLYFYSLNELQVRLLELTEGALGGFVAVAQDGFVDTAVKDRVHLWDEL